MNDFGEKKEEILNYIMEVYGKFDEGNTHMPCPICGTPIHISRCGEWKQSGIIYCKTPNCLNVTFQGL